MYNVVVKSTIPLTSVIIYGELILKHRGLTKGGFLLSAVKFFDNLTAFP